MGKVLRLPLRLIPKCMVLPILQGRLRGTKWVVGAGEHGYWLGSYEITKRLAFEKQICPREVVYDIGANVGYYSLLASILTGKEGKVYAFEPLPRNVAYIRKHIAINHLDNIDVFEVAVSDREGESAFDPGVSIATGHLTQSGGISVRVTKLDDMLKEGIIRPPTTMKIDVEGAEYAVLCGARHLLETYFPVIFLDTHARQAHDASLALLESLGYHFSILDGKPLPQSKELIAFPQTIEREGKL